jgi:stalled ribosome alternative rescue factor ArfA
MRIKPINPVAKAVAQNRRRTATQVAPPKKGKGSYNRNKEKRNNANQVGKNESTQD